MLLRKVTFGDQGSESTLDVTLKIDSASGQPFISMTHTGGGQWSEKAVGPSYCDGFDRIKFGLQEVDNYLRRKWIEQESGLKASVGVNYGVRPQDQPTESALLCDSFIAHWAFNGKRVESDEWRPFSLLLHSPTRSSSPQGKRLWAGAVSLSYEKSPRRLPEVDDPVEAHISTLAFALGVIKLFESQGYIFERQPDGKEPLDADRLIALFTDKVASDGVAQALAAKVPIPP